MCHEAPGEIAHMERLGVPFHRNEHGRLATRSFGAASQPRTQFTFFPTIPAASASNA